MLSQKKDLIQKRWQKFVVDKELHEITDMKALSAIRILLENDKQHSHQLSNIYKWADRDLKIVNARIKELLQVNLPKQTPQLNIF